MNTPHVGFKNIEELMARFKFYNDKLNRAEVERFEMLTFIECLNSYRMDYAVHNVNGKTFIYIDKYLCSIEL